VVLQQIGQALNVANQAVSTAGGLVNFIGGLNPQRQVERALKAQAAYDNYALRQQLTTVATASAIQQGLTIGGLNSALKTDNVLDGLPQDLPVIPQQRLNTPTNQFGGGNPFGGNAVYPIPTNSPMAPYLEGGSSGGLTQDGAPTSPPSPAVTAQQERVDLALKEIRTFSAANPELKELSDTFIKRFEDKDYKKTFQTTDDSIKNVTLALKYLETNSERVSQDLGKYINLFLQGGFAAIVKKSKESSSNQSVTT
jgi:hypothetical protein